MLSFRVVGLLEALAGDLEALKAHRKTQQQAAGLADLPNLSILPVFDDGAAKQPGGMRGTAAAKQPQDDGSASSTKLPAQSTTGGEMDAEGAGAKSNGAAPQALLHDDIDGLLEGLDVGDILDLGLPDASESAWAAADKALQASFSCSMPLQACTCGTADSMHWRPRGWLFEHAESII